jgi:calcineurin-like phosphoesterase family protein
MDHILYSADHHLFHDAMREYAPLTRGQHIFASVADMNECIVETHNQHATSDTHVFVLGDFAKGGSLSELRRCFDKMVGIKHLVSGNHDNRDVLRLDWASIRPWRELLDGEHAIYLSHCPAESSPGLDEGVYHFHGHTHAKKPSRGRSIDVGVDAWGMRPVTAEQAIERMRRRNPNFYSLGREREFFLSPDGEEWDEAGTYSSEILSEDDELYRSRHSERQAQSIYHRMFGSR